MENPAASKKRLPTLVNLEIEYTEGGSSPAFNREGRSVIASLTSEPTNADIFAALAHDGSMGALNTFLDTAQPSVGHVALVCYILLGVVLVTLLFVMPLVAFGFRRYTATVSVVTWLGCEVFLLVCASIQFICLLTMVTSWYGMSDGLGEKLPEAYEWTFELLRNFTEVAIDQLKSKASPAVQKTLDAVATTTLKGINTLRGNLSAWEARYEGYEGLKRALTGLLTIIHMILLGVALTVIVASASVAIVAWKRRKAALEAGKRSPVYVATIAFGGAVLQLAHMAMALPLIARWLPLCVLTETYVCSPYREGVYTVLDDGAARVWPEVSRPDPFCRMVPGKLAILCTVKGKSSIGELPSCPTKGAKKALTIGDSDAEVELPYPLQRWNKLPLQRAKAAGKIKEKPKGDCFFPYKIVDTDLTAACPLFTDDLVAHWMALVISTFFGPLTVFAVSTIGAIYMAVSEKTRNVSKKVPREKKRRIKRKKRSKTKKKAKKGDSKDKTAETPSPAPVPLLPESAATPSRSTSIIKIVPSLPDIQRTVLFPVPVPVPVKTTQKRHRRRSEPRSPAIMVPPPPCFPRFRPPFVSAPFLTPPAFVPQPATPTVSAAKLSVPFNRPAAPPVRHCHVAPCTHWRSHGGASSATPTGKSGRWSIATETLQPGMPALVSSPVARSAAHKSVTASPERGPLTTTSSKTTALVSSRPGSEGTVSNTRVARFATCTMQRPA